MESDFNSLIPEALFDLTKFQHATIFDNILYAWEVLPKISVFLATLPLGKIEVEIPFGAILENPSKITIGEGSVIEAGCYIKGPCYIGKNCTIRHGAYLRGNVITGNACIIGHDTEVKNSLFFDKAKAPHFAYIGDSIVGNNVNIGAGTKCANIKLNQAEIIVTYREKKINTGLYKFGALIGDGCQIGCNTVLNPGTILGRYVDCYPNVNLSGVIEANQLIKSNATLSFQSKAKLKKSN
jgi:NDP-sugar pyrophosphorylase family protein